MNASEISSLPCNMLTQLKCSAGNVSVSDKEHKLFISAVNSIFTPRRAKATTAATQNI